MRIWSIILCAMMVSLGFSSFVHAEPILLQYDDGSSERGIFPISADPGSEVAVIFTPTVYPAKLLKIQFLVTGDSYADAPFEIRVYEGNSGDFPAARLDNGSITGTGPSEAIWAEVDVSQQNIIIEDGKFFVSMYWPVATPWDASTIIVLALDMNSTIHGGACFKQGNSGDWALLAGSGADGNPMIRAVIEEATDISDCLTIKNDLSMKDVCLTYSGVNYEIDFIYYDKAGDPNIFWQLDAKSLSIAEPGSACIAVQSDLSLTIPCAEFMGNEYGFTLVYDSALNWKLDLSSLVVY